MTDIEQAKFIAAFVKSGLELREWRDVGRQWKLTSYEGRLDFWYEKDGKWQDPGDYTDRDIVNELLRQLQERCDYAGVVIRIIYPWPIVRGLPEPYWQWRVAISERMLEGKALSRPEAMLAACVAIDREPST